MHKPWWKLWMLTWVHWLETQAYEIRIVVCRWTDVTIPITSNFDKYENLLSWCLCYNVINGTIIKVCVISVTLVNSKRPPSRNRRLQDIVCPFFSVRLESRIEVIAVYCCSGALPRMPTFKQCYCAKLRTNNDKEICRRSLRFGMVFSCLFIRQHRGFRKLINLCIRHPGDGSTQCARILALA